MTFDVAKAVLSFVLAMARARKPLDIIVIGNEVSISNGKYIVPCSSCESADLVGDALQVYYNRYC